LLGEDSLYVVIGETVAVVEPPALMWGPLLASAALMGLLIGSLLIFMQRLVLRQVRDLAEGAAIIGAGDFEYEIPVRGRDELGFLARTFNEMAARLHDLVGTLEQQVAERTDALRKRGQQLQAVALVSKEAATVRDVSHLLKRTVTAIATQFNYYHVGIFLLDDEQEWAVLRAVSSEGGQRMLARGHRLRVGQQGIVGSVSATGRPRIALDVGVDAVWFNTSELPETHSEMALPLVNLDQQVVGVLDVQSVEQGAFTDEDIETLQLLADQISVALQNARLLEQTRFALAELETMQRDQSRQGWARVADRIRPQAYEYDRVGVQPVLPLPTSPALLGGTGVRQVMLGADNPYLISPLQYRGETIAMLSLSDPERNWTDEEITLIKSISDQVAIALENARLFEEAQRTARSQELLNQVLQSASSMSNAEVALQEIAVILARGLNMAVGIFTFLSSDASKIQPQALTLPSGENLLAAAGIISLPLDLQIFFRGLSRPEMGKVLPIFEELDLAQNYDLGRVLYVAIRTATKKVGFIALIQRVEDILLDPDTRELAQSLANQIAVVVENLNLLTETERRSTELRELYELSLRFGDVVEVKETQDLLVERAAEVLVGDAGVFAHYNEREELLVLSSIRGLTSPAAFEGREIQPEEGLAGYVFAQNKSLRIDDYRSWERRDEWLPESEIGSAMAVPLGSKEQLLGVLLVFRSPSQAPFDSEAVRLAELLAAQAVVALENARLFHEARIRAEELVALNELAQALTSQLHVQAVLETTYQGAARLLDATNFYIAFCDEKIEELSFPLVMEDGELVMWQARQMEQKGLTEHIMRQKQPLLIREHVEEWILQNLTGVGIGRASLSWLGAPLMIGDRVLGVIAVQSYTTPRVYDEHARDLLVSIAGQTAIAIQSARLFEQAQRRAQHERQIYEITSRLRRSPDMATILQTAAAELGQALGADRVLVRLRGREVSESAPDQKAMESEEESAARLKRSRES
ncbi:MAG: GAF domain-containing protein, partial [Anaerolineae bacterium]|nr:GAF domain-containing protein [Anaerolineae bacterium]